jgi:hypothetical protein
MRGICRPEHLIRVSVEMKEDILEVCIYYVDYDDMFIDNNYNSQDITSFSQYFFYLFLSNYFLLQPIKLTTIYNQYFHKSDIKHT